MIRRPPRSTPLYSSAASDVYKRQVLGDQIKLFADDTNLFVSGCIIGDTNFYSNVKLNNKFSVNIEKTSYMTFPRNKANETLLCINNQVVNKVLSRRYLGVITDDELKWTDHINHVYKKLNKVLKYILQIKKYAIQSST